MKGDVQGKLFTSDDHRGRLRRTPLTVQRDCFLGVITFENRERTDHHARIVDLSATGIGIESEGPIEPGLVWFKDSVYGQKCGVLVWCQNTGPRYRAGIQFLSLNQTEEDCLRHQMEGSQQHNPPLDSRRVVATLIDSIRKDREAHTDGELRA